MIEVTCEHVIKVVVIKYTYKGKDYTNSILGFPNFVMLDFSGKEGHKRNI